MKQIIGILILAVVVTSAGCQQKTIDHVQPVANSGGNPHSNSRPLDFRDFQGVLDQYFVEGRVKYRSLKENTGLLDDLVKSLEHIGPKSTPDDFPTPDHAAAYWINAHNAVALRAAVEIYPKKTVRPFWGDFSEKTLAVVDGRALTLRQMADLAREAGGGDLRIELALCLPATGCNKLSTVYQADQLDEQLTDAVKRALDDPQIVVVDHERRALMLGRPLYRIRNQFIEKYNRSFGTQDATMVNALGLYADVSQRRRLNAAIGYRVMETRFDWSLNEQQEPSYILDRLDDDPSEQKGD